MFLDDYAVFYIVDKATRFSSATSLDKRNATFCQSVEDIWLAFLTIWSLAYSGYPNRLQKGQASVFTSDRWKQLADLNRIQPLLSGAEAHSSSKIDKRYHDHLRQIYCRIRYSHSLVPPQYLFKVAVKEMNDTMEEKDLVSSRPIFGIIPRIPILSTDLLSQEECMEAWNSAQAEMNLIVTERRVLGGPARNILRAADWKCKIGEKVLVFPEVKKEWIGFFEVFHAEGKMVTV